MKYAPLRLCDKVRRTAFSRYDAHHHQPKFNELNAALQRSQRFLHKIIHSFAVAIVRVMPRLSIFLCQEREAIEAGMISSYSHAPFFRAILHFLDRPGLNILFRLKH